MTWNVKILGGASPSKKESSLEGMESGGDWQRPELLRAKSRVGLPCQLVLSKFV